MARKTGEELEKIKKKHKVPTIWSWSRYNAYKSDPYTYYLKYVRRIKEDRNTSIYSYSGGICHIIMEKMYGNEIKYKDMLPLYEDELMKFNMAELKYNRSNDDKNDTTANKYEDCIRHFFQHHNVIVPKVTLEKFITIKVGKHLLQGYIDVLYKEGDKYRILDWKTSSIYTGKKILSEQGQLLLYSEALIQKGVPIENIAAGWNFLKYVTIEIPQANGKTKLSHRPRNEIGLSLKTNATMWLKKTGRYSQEEIDDIIDLMIQTNTIDVLPDDVKSKYTVRDCVIDIELTQENVDNLKQDINDTLNEILIKEVEYHKTEDENIFWQDVTDKESFWMHNLSSYSRKIHKPYNEYLLAREEKLGREEKGTDEVEENDDDLSWMEEL